jgi:parvulin-like peptidyl-prolyl isomerase
MKSLVAAVMVVIALASAAADIVDRVMAVVNGNIVTQSDVYGALVFGLVTPADGQDRLGSGLEELIERELVLAEVNRYSPPEPSEEQIDAIAAQMRARFPSPDAYRRALEANGYTDDRVRAAARDTIRIQSYVNQRFGTSLRPDERAAVVSQWKAGLRRRAEIAIQYQPAAR